MREADVVFEESRNRRSVAVEDDSVVWVAAIRGEKRTLLLVVRIEDRIGIRTISMSRSMPDPESGCANSNVVAFELYVPYGWLQARPYATKPRETLAAKVIKSTSITRYSRADALTTSLRASWCKFRASSLPTMLEGAFNWTILFLVRTSRAGRHRTNCVARADRMQ